MKNSITRITFPAALVAGLGAAGTALAAPDCTSEPKDKWMSEEQMKAKATEMGYKIRVFRVSGPCYEIYGEKADGKKVEVYFNPVTGAVVKEEDD